MSMSCKIRYNLFFFSIDVTSGRSRMTAKKDAPDNFLPKNVQGPPSLGDDDYESSSIRMSAEESTHESGDLVTGVDPVGKDIKHHLGNQPEQPASGVYCI